ncbi:MAG: MazG nucleotide pyrophosphohydrolase domain-containing protein [Actinomycetota bacterium]
MAPDRSPDRPQVTVCGLGPGGPGRMTEQTAALLGGPDPVLLRTARHPGTDRIPVTRSFDDIYEAAGSFDDVYRTITDEVVAAAAEAGHVVYAVPGSPLVLERSVRHLRNDKRIGATVLPAVSFLDEVWARLGVDPVEDAVRLVDGLTFAADAVGERGPLLVAHAHADWVLSDIKLALDAGPEQRVLVLQALGTDRERIVDVAWPDLDRVVEADHLTSLYLPEVVAPVGRELLATVEMMHTLRNECPWDREQTHRSLRRYLIEEAYEVLDAIDDLPTGPAGADGRPIEHDAFVDLEEELGDLWFQILFHAELAAEAGRFTMADVARGLREKMIRRHPHVYGPEAEGSEVTTGALAKSWEAMKREEKGRGSVLDGIPRSLPSLALAEKTLKKADGAGGRAELGPLESRLTPLLPPDATADDVGQILLGLVELARRAGVNAEQALRTATDAAADRFRTAEASGPLNGRWIAG